MGKAKEQWGTRLGVILAVAGSAVGLGNFLRFPGQAAQYGGGAFMIPYFCALIFLGIPICWAEWIMGRAGGRQGVNSCPAIFGVLGRRKGWRFMGVLGLLIPVAVYMYYVIIEAWCLGYAWSFLTGSLDLGQDKTEFAAKSAEFYSDFTGQGADGALLAGGLQPLLIFFLITFTINFLLIYRGISKGIEAFCIRAMPVMAICAVIVLVRVMTLGTPDETKPQRTVSNGLGFMWNPQASDADVDKDGIRNVKDDDIDGDGIANELDSDVDGDGIGNVEDRDVGGLPDAPWYLALFNPETWLAAAGQIFFSLSVGFGIIVNYSSYLRRKDDVVLSGLTAASTNEFFEVCLGGLITIPAAFIFLGAAGIVGSLDSSFSLGFKTMPVVFEYMPLGSTVGFIWFFMLFLAAVTSSLSMLQPAIAFLEEGLGVGRKVSVAMMGVVTALGSGFIIYFSKDLMALDTVDFWVGTAMIFVLAMIEVILFAWVFGVDKGYAEAQHGAELQIPKIWKFVIKYVSPTFLLAVFVLWCKDKLPERIDGLMSPEGRVALYAVGLMAAIAVLFMVLICLSSRRFDERERLALSAGQTENAS